MHVVISTGTLVVKMSALERCFDLSQRIEADGKPGGSRQDPDPAAGWLSCSSLTCQRPGQADVEILEKSSRSDEPLRLFEAPKAV